MHPMSGVFRSMNFNNITIIGVGLIGSSFALSLKQRGFKGTITGVGRREEYLARIRTGEKVGVTS